MKKKINKPSRCHNPQKAWTPRRHFAAANVLIRGSCPSRVPSCNHASAIAPQFLFGLVHIAFLLFCPFLLTTDLKRFCLKRDCNTIAFPGSSSLHMWTLGVLLFYWLAWPLFELIYPSEKAWHAYKSLEGKNSHSFFEKISPLQIIMNVD